MFPQRPKHNAPVRIAAVVLLAVLIVLAWMAPLDGRAKEHAEAGLKRALATFATARVANAVISVIQEASISAGPVFVGATVKPGEVLDPVNDLIEQLSTLMLVASVSLGMQLLLIHVGGHFAVNAAVTLALLAWAALLLASRRNPVWFTRVVVVLLFVRFAAPLAALGSEGVYQLTLDPVYQQSQKALDTSSRQLAASASAEDVRGWILDAREKLRNARERLEGAVRHIVELMAIFLVQTVVLPILFAWVAYRLFFASFRAVHR